MIQIFFDIENTIIDDLWNCNFVPEKCDAIVRWLHKRFSFVPVGKLKCNLFTWGWKERSEIVPEVVTNIFNRLELPLDSTRGFVWTKDDSIRCAFDHKWVNTTDETEIEDLHIPGAMRRFGLEKQTCFIQQVKDFIDFENINSVDDVNRFILVDDTNNMLEKETRTFTNRHGAELEIEFLHPENLL